jgi:hypothetical protein
VVEENETLNEKKDITTHVSRKKEIGSQSRTFISGYNAINVYFEALKIKSRERERENPQYRDINI